MSWLSEHFSEPMPFPSADDWADSARRACSALAATLVDVLVLDGCGLAVAAREPHTLRLSALREQLHHEGRLRQLGRGESATVEAGGLHVLQPPPPLCSAAIESRRFETRGRPGENGLGHHPGALEQCPALGCASDGA